MQPVADCGKCCKGQNGNQRLQNCTPESRSHDMLDEDVEAHTPAPAAVRNHFTRQTGYLGRVLYKAMSRANTSPEQIGEELLGIEPSVGSADCRYGPGLRLRTFRCWFCQS